MQQFFNGMYTMLISWFYQRKPASFGLYKSEIFNTIGLCTLLVALGLGLIFYYIFNGQKLALNQLNWSKPTHWLLVLLLAAGVGALLAYRVSIKQGATPESYLRYFIIVNTLVAPFWYFLFSLGLKRLFANQARTTPF